MKYPDLTTSAGLDQRVTRCRARYKRLWRDFSNFRSYCQELAEFFWPERANFTTDRTPGTDMQDGLFTGTPQVFRRDFGNKIGTVMRPANEEWFRLVARPEEMMSNDPIRYWCDLVTRQQRRILYDRRANYASTMAVGDQDYVTFGNAVSWCAYNKGGDGLLFRPVHLRDVVWAESYEGIVNEVYERLKMPLGQVVELFGKDKLPREWRRLLEKKDGDFNEVMVIRAAIPIDSNSYEKGRRPPQGMTTAVIYFADEENRGGESGALGESFCEMMPYTVRRWMPLGEPWGRSLCTSVSLADARVLNVAEMATLKGIEMIVDPPRWAENEAVVTDVEMTPGGITYVDTSNMTNTRDPLGVIQGGDPRHAMDFLQHKRDQMAMQWFENLWKFPDREMTAYETSERMQIMTEDATPVFQPMEADQAMQMDVVFSKSSARGAFPPPPEELMTEGGLVEWEFETPVTASLRKTRALRARNIVDNVQVARQVIPTFGDQVDWVSLEREMIVGMGPENWVLPREVVLEQQRLREEAQMEAQQQEDMLETAKVAASARPENLRALERE
jgi:hypothetical protein